MTDKEITAIYQTLAALDVKLDQTPQLGPEYLRDRLLECREKQDKATDLTLQVNRAYSASRQRLRALQAAVRHADGSAQADQLRADKETTYNEGDALKLLRDAINVRRANLIRTASDIRLLTKIIEEDKPATPGGASAKPVLDAGQTPEKVTVRGPFQDPPAGPRVYVDEAAITAAAKEDLPITAAGIEAPKEQSQPVVRQIEQVDEDIELFLSGKGD